MVTVLNFINVKFLGDMLELSLDNALSTNLTGILNVVYR